MKMNTQQLVAALITSALAFKHKWDADVEAQQTERALLTTEEEKTKFDATAIETELEESDWWDAYTQSVEDQGLAKFLKSADPDVLCISKVNAGEPMFTLRGQDILASILVRHWASLAALNGDIEESKLDHAEVIAERMEEYTPQKWPD